MMRWLLLSSVVVAVRAYDDCEEVTCLGLPSGLHDIRGAQVRRL